MTLDIQNIEDNRMYLARKCDAAIMDAWNGLNKRSMIIGWNGRILKEQQLFVELGYAGEHDYWEKKGVGKVTWYKMTGLATKFAGVSEASFYGMKIENALLLAMLDNLAERYDLELMAKAGSQTVRQFEATLAEFKHSQGGPPPGKQTTKYEFQMNRDQKRVIESKLREWMSDHNIINEGEALEMLVAEYSDRFTLSGYLKQACERLEVASAGCSQESALRTEVNLMVIEMREALAFTWATAKAEAEQQPGSRQVA